MISPSRMPRARPLSARRVTIAGVVSVLAGCGALGPRDLSQSPTPTRTPLSATSTSAAPASSPSPSSPAPTASSASLPPPATGGVTLSACGVEALRPLTKEQRIGQLLMVALDTAAQPNSLAGLIADTKVGNVIYLGGWRGANRVRAASAELQGRATAQATGSIGLIIGADQEGGTVRQLRGNGFSPIPAAIDQARMTPEELRAEAAIWAQELASAGVNLNLAPVADTVPTAVGKSNEPIGAYGRQYGSSPAEVSESITAFIEGMSDREVMTSVKHFPGLGRVKSSTDYNATGITDETATVNDPYLQPFMVGVKAGAGLVMVSSARYPKIDASSTQAMFSRPILTDLLRTTLGFAGVVITDDINAEAVRSIPIGKRAVDYINAGGDILLTAAPATAPELANALAAARDKDSAFATKLDASVARVIALKDRMGLLPCS